MWNVMRVIGAILLGNLWGLCRWTGLPHRLDMAFSRWLLTHEPVNWSAWVQKWKAPVQRAKELIKRF